MQENEQIAFELIAFELLYHSCVEFVRKCDAGEAKSCRSYAEMKIAIAEANKALSRRLVNR